MKLLRVLLRYSRGLLVSAAVVGALGGAASAGLMALINHSLEAQAAVPDMRVVWAFASLCLLVPASRFLSSLLLLMLGQRAVLDMRLDLSRRILSAPLRRLEELGSPRLLVALTDDLESITQAMMVLPVLCINGALIAGCLAYLGYLSWQILVGMLVCMVVGVSVYQVALSSAMKRLRQVRETRDELFDHFQGLNEGIKELKLHEPRQGRFLDLLEGTGDQLRKLSIVALATLNAAASWGHVLLFGFIGLVLFAAPSLGLGASEALSGFTLVLIFILGPIEVVMDSLPVLGRASVAVGKVEELGLSLVAEGSPAKAITRGDGWQRLELRGVQCTYHTAESDEAFTLGPLDLEFRRGELIFLVGGNGSGKTTLAKVLTGLYGPEEGELCLDGRPVDDDLRAWYRQHFSVVFSDFFLFETLLGLEREGLDEEARGYLQQLRLEHKVQVRDGALSTTELSQGQRKRLALLTAYMEDRPIYLFDEWAADQDPQFKEIFYMQLLPELRSRGKTVFVISHDDRYYAVADRLVKLENGGVSFDGSPQSAAVLVGEAV